MAAPHFSGPTAVSESADGLIRSAVNSAHNISDAGPEMIRVVRGFGVIAGKAWPEAETLAEREVAVEAGAALMEMGLGVLLALVLFVIICMYWLLHAIRHLVGSIPLIGGAGTFIVDINLAYLDPIVHWLSAQANFVLSGLLHATVIVVDWALQQGAAVGRTTIHALISTYVEPIKHEADTLWGWLQHESNRVTHLYNEVHGLHNQPIANTIPLYEQVHRLQATVQSLATAVEGSRIETAGLRVEVGALSAGMQNLAAQLHGVHNVDIGWTDVAAQVGQLQGNVTQLGSTLAPQIGHNSAMLDLLAPLGILLPAGARGLENLRKLEDNPCQCPRLPGLSNELGTALAIMHHMKGD